MCSVCIVTYVSTCASSSGTASWGEGCVRCVRVGVWWMQRGDGLARGVGFVLVGADVWEGVGCEELDGREFCGWSGVVWVGIMVGVWKGPLSVCLVSGACGDMGAWRGKEVWGLLVHVVALCCE